MSRGPSRRPERPGLRLLVLLLAAGVAASTPSPAWAQDGGFSLLAVGDTGAELDDADARRTQLDVAAAMAESDRGRPVDALVLLGDNFYPDGLLRSELALRTRENLARPYCRFLEIAKFHAAEIGDACQRPAAARPPIPFYAVLGNHDHGSPESPELQRSALREYFANWHMPAGVAAVHELAGGVSLVLFDSDPIFEGADVAPLIYALHASQGPWRILAAHHPIANRDRGPETERHARYRRLVLDAVAAADVTVQLVLSGHEHNLQLFTLDPPAPALHAVAGGGSGARSLHGPDPHRVAGFEEPGFARVDIQGVGEAARLTASLYGLPRLLVGWVSDQPRLLARWSVDLEGHAREE